MEPKTLAYAAIGAPVTIARTAIENATTYCKDLSEKGGGYQNLTDEKIAEWATEGEKVLKNLTDSEIVEEVAGKVDIDNARTQVSKLRDQLEEMLGTWRSSFTPEVDEDTKAS
ncbi:MAG: hypothetical protein GEU79_10215 [Acidimicrobiia bacterium]|nr:hypothetical protein [Acidimicrobiia bacterium]